MIYQKFPKIFIPKLILNKNNFIKKNVYLCFDIGLFWWYDYLAGTPFDKKYKSTNNIRTIIVRA